VCVSPTVWVSVCYVFTLSQCVTCSCMCLSQCVCVCLSLTVCVANSQCVCVSFSVCVSLCVFFTVTLTVSLFVCLPGEMSTNVWQFEDSSALPFFGIEMTTDLFQSCGHCRVFKFCWHIECSTIAASYFRI